VSEKTGRQAEERVKMGERIERRMPPSCYQASEKWG